MRVLNQRKLLTGALLALSLMTTNQAAYADQPAALTWKILEAAKEGTALAGYTQGGDSRLLVQLSPWDLKQRTPLLVVFRSCGGDPIAVDKPMLNFEAYMAGKDTSPIYDPDWKAPEPRWRLCPETDAVLVYPNSTTPQQVLLNVDFLGYPLKTGHEVTSTS